MIVRTPRVKVGHRQALNCERPVCKIGRSRLCELRACAYVHVCSSEPDVFVQAKSVRSLESDVHEVCR
jgi:hypothetical protein